MTNIALRVNVGGLVNAKNLIQGEAVARLSDAVQHVSAMMVTRWQIAVHKAKLWSGESDQYAATIAWRMTGTLRAEVYSDYRYAQEIDDGRPGRDLKDMLNTSLKVRTSKAGKRYLIIPFRHNTPGYNAHAHDMPEHVYAAAKKLPFSKVTGMGTRLSGTGAFDMKTRQPLRVKQATYLWGGRLPAGSMGPNPKGKTDRFAGMVRFEETSGKGKKSTYLTFRVMVEGSPGWVTKAQPGLKIAEALVAEMTPIAQEELLGAARGAVL